MSPTPTLPTLRVANADAVTEALLVGGDLDVVDPDLAMRQRAELLDAGVTHVLDVRHELDDGPLWADTEVRYHRDGIDDAGQRVPAWWFERVVAWAQAALAEPGSRLLVHCHMGVNRGPSAAYAVLLAQGLDPVSALATLREARPVAHAWYAEDALAWWHERSGTPDAVRDDDRARLAAWRADHPLDVVRVIAAQRAVGR